MKAKRGFTLIEILIVVIIIGILSAISIPLFEKTRDRVMDKEAISMLKVLRSAQKGYRMDSGSYYASNAHASINTNLRTTLPVEAGRNWNYSVYNGANGCSKAISCKGAARTFFTLTTMEEPAKVSGTNPLPDECS